MSNSNCTTTHALMFFFLLSLLLVNNHDFFNSSPSNPKSPKHSKPKDSSCNCNCPATTPAAPKITLLAAFLSGVLFTLLSILTIKVPTLIITPIQSALNFARSCAHRIKRTRQLPEPVQSSPEKGGISNSLLNSLPTFAYSAEKPPKFGKGAGMCAICLSKFLNEETLRWLPDCDHLFHQKCVDTWLECNKTCPCCRANVERSGGEILLLTNGENSAEMRSTSFRRDSSGRDVDDRRRIGCERSVVSGLFRVLMGRRRNHGHRAHHR